MVRRALADYSSRALLQYGRAMCWTANGAARAKTSPVARAKTSRVGLLECNTHLHGHQPVVHLHLLGEKVRADRRLVVGAQAQKHEVHVESTVILFTNKLLKTQAPFKPGSSLHRPHLVLFAELAIDVLVHKRRLADAVV